jgi:hypothetical protein
MEARYRGFAHAEILSFKKLKIFKFLKNSLKKMQNAHLRLNFLYNILKSCTQFCRGGQRWVNAARIFVR